MTQAAPIVVGTDLSHHSDLAVAVASQRAQNEGAPLLVAHVASEQTYAEIDPAKVGEALRQHVMGLTTMDVECDLLAGSAHAELIKLADKRGAALVVIGASGAGDVSDALFGTTAENVVRYAHGPVLVVRDSPKDSKVIVATDFSEASTPAVRAAISEAKKAGVDLVLFHSTHETKSRLDLLAQLQKESPEAIKTRHSAAQKALEDLLKKEGAQGECLVVDTPPGEGLASLAEETKASLVVVGTHGRTGLKRMALGSIAANVVRTAPCSVLVVR